MEYWNKILCSLMLSTALASTVFAESYNSLEASVKSAQARVEEKRKKIKELGEKKSLTKDEAQIRGILDEMVVEAKEMRDNFARFQKEKKRLKYQFPSKGDDAERQYRRFELETIEELNSVSTIDLRLKGLMTQIERVYEKPPEVLEKERLAREERRKSSGKMRSKDTPKNEEVSPTDSRPKLVN